MAGASGFENLPDELLLEIISFLGPRDIVGVQALSKRLLKICRDNSFWRLRCLDESAWLVGMRRRQDLRQIEAETHDDFLNAATGHSADLAGNPEGTRRPSILKRERVRILANWNPEFPGESTKWYDEYIHRTAPVAVNWLEQPRSDESDGKTAMEARGLALYRPNRVGDSLYAVSPLDDGSICLWDVKGARRRKGAIIAKGSSDTEGSRIDLLHRSKAVNTGITNCISVDSQASKAFLAIENLLLEIDLETLKIIGVQPYEWTITTLSTADPGLPVTVGTFNGIHLHDHRTRVPTPPNSQDTIDGFDRQALLSVLDPNPDPLPPYSPLAQSGPLAILHMEQVGGQGLISDDIFVAGRFSNILHYDRRMFPRIRGSLYSGARLTSLASLPYPFSSVDSELRRGGQLSTEQAESSKDMTGERTLLACGEYNTKGSLEVYGLSAQGSDPTANFGMSHNSVFKNRQTASNSKLLSVINHGTRILFSDGQGYLKWAERDAFTEVRRHKIGHAEKPAERSLFASMPGSDELARKLLSTGQGNDAKANDDDVLFWTGEKLGLVTFSSKPGFAADEFEQTTQTPEEIAAEKEEQVYSERMRLALERQANDVHFVRYLGAGIRDRL